MSITKIVLSNRGRDKNKHTIPVKEPCEDWEIRGIKGATYQFFVPGASLHYLLQLDEKFIGTNSYLGLAFFWSHDYRHYLREQSPTRLQKIHQELLKAGLTPHGVSSEHEAVIKKYRHDKVY
jgi:hypothetical protein